MNNLSQKLLPQKIDTKIFQYSCLLSLFFYGVYSFWLSFSPNQEDLLARPIDLSILVLISLIFPLSLLIIFLLVNLLHTNFIKNFDELEDTSKFAVTSPVNWHFFGILQSIFISINWMMLTIPSYFSDPSLWKILTNTAVDVVDRTYLLSLSLIWIFLQVGVVLLYQRKSSGNIAILLAFLICLLGCIKKIVEPPQLDITILELLKPAIAIGISLAVIHFSKKKILGAMKKK